MKKVLAILVCMFAYISKAQVSCETFNKSGSSFSLTACKNGKAKLFHTDTAITNKFKHRSFDLRTVNDLSEADKAEIKKYKLPLNPTDTVIMYDWDIMHQAKMGYFGPAVGKVKFNCKDSVMYIYKFLLKKETTNYVPTRYKVFKMGMDNFIMFDMDHPYLNINYYFKRK